MPDIAFELDTSEFEEALEETQQAVSFADYVCITENSKQFLHHIVRNELGYRSGNLRSAAIPPWKALGMPGKPLTNVPLGEKELTYRNSRGKNETNRFFSNGTVDDQRRRPENPYFRYDLFAAEWRTRSNKSGGKSISDILRSGLITPSDAAKAVMMLGEGASFMDVYYFLIGILSGSGAGRTFLMENGYFKPYQFIKKGSRKTITGKFVFKDWYEKAMKKHEGRQ